MHALCCECMHAVTVEGVGNRKSGLHQIQGIAYCLQDVQSSSPIEIGLERNGGCWQDVQSNVTACKDTFRGRVCECPLVKGVQFMKTEFATSSVGQVGILSGCTPAMIEILENRQ